MDDKERKKETQMGLFEEHNGLGGLKDDSPERARHGDSSVAEIDR
jgi:hypothetical protein